MDNKSLDMDDVLKRVLALDKAKKKIIKIARKNKIIKKYFKLVNTLIVNENDKNKVKLLEYMKKKWKTLKKINIEQCTDRCPFITTKNNIFWVYMLYFSEDKFLTNEIKSLSNEIKNIPSEFQHTLDALTENINDENISYKISFIIRLFESACWCEKKEYNYYIRFKVFNKAINEFILYVSDFDNLCNLFFKGILKKIENDVQKQIYFLRCFCNVCDTKTKNCDELMITDYNKDWETFTFGKQEIKYNNLQTNLYNTQITTITSLNYQQYVLPCKIVYERFGRYIFWSNSIEKDYNDKYKINLDQIKNFEAIFDKKMPECLYKPTFDKYYNDPYHWIFGRFYTKDERLKTETTDQNRRNAIKTNQIQQNLPIFFGITLTDQKKELINSVVEHIKNQFDQKIEQKKFENNDQLKAFFQDSIKIKKHNFGIEKDLKNKNWQGDVMYNNTFSDETIQLLSYAYFYHQQEHNNKKFIERKIEIKKQLDHGTDKYIYLNETVVFVRFMENYINNYNEIPNNKSKKQKKVFAKIEKIKKKILQNISNKEHFLKCILFFLDIDLINKDIVKTKHTEKDSINAIKKKILEKIKTTYFKEDDTTYIFDQNGYVNTILNKIIFDPNEGKSLSTYKHLFF